MWNQGRSSDLTLPESPLKGPVFQMHPFLLACAVSPPRGVGGCAGHSWVPPRLPCGVVS